MLWRILISAIRINTNKVITMLQNDIPLEEKYRDHELKGKYQGFRECHIQPDLFNV